jgi:hypothetical protein
MKNQVSAITDCRLFGEYVDEGMVPEKACFHEGEVVRPRMVADYCDDSKSADNCKDFTVLLRDGRELAIRGHALRHSPHAIAGEDVYSIVMRNSGGESVIALFKSSDVAGIFHGETRGERRIA